MNSISRSRSVIRMQAAVGTVVPLAVALVLSSCSPQREHHPVPAGGSAKLLHVSGPTMRRVQELGAETTTNEATLREWLGHHPDDVGASIALAYCLYGRGDKAAARATLDAALVAGHDLRVIKAQAVVTDDDPVERETLARRILAIDPEDFAGHELLGLALYARGQYDSAATELSHVTTYCFTHAGSWYNLGLARLYSGRRNDAIEAFAASASIDLTAAGGLPPAPVLGLAAAYDGDANWPDASARYSVLAALPPDVPLAARFPSVPPRLDEGPLRYPPFLDEADLGVVFGDAAEPAKVTWVSKHSTGSAAGIALGDVILAVDGRVVTEPARLMHGFDPLPTEREFVVRIRRNGAEIDLRARAIADAKIVDRVRGLLGKAVEAAQAQRHLESAAVHREVLDTTYYNREAALALPLQLHFAGNTADALAAIDAWCALSPHDVELLRYQIALGNESGDAVAVGRSFERARALCPNNGAVAAHEAWRAWQAGDSPRSRELFERALALGQCGGMLQRIAREIDGKVFANSLSSSVASAPRQRPNDGGQDAMLMLMFANALQGAFGGGRGESGYSPGTNPYQINADNMAMQARLP